MLVEMLILSLLARKLYKQPLPEFTESNNNIEQVYARSAHVTTIAAIMSQVPPLQTAETQQPKPKALTDSFNGKITRF